MRTKTLVGAMALIAGLGASHLALGQGTLPLTNKGGINPDSWVYGPRNDDATAA